MDFLSRSLKAQMREADRLQAKYVLILGEDELKKKIITLREMATKEQKEVALDEVSGTLTKLLEK
jgi:histidyl-tRNA synthetase